MTAQVPDVTPSGTTAHPSAGIPARIHIDAISVASPVVPVGLEGDGTLGLPPAGSAAWYSLGVRPGERGYSVIAAHVDNHRGPDVFYQLRKLKTGDRVVIADIDGGSHTFEVQHVEQQPKQTLPTSTIWEPVEHPRLALITCGGAFDRSTRSYRDNVVVHAALLQ
ncbi:MAG TPA: class F sortase [Mycobacteriales bacterium]|nr:class F sortase [Mycobacteriales bacterium]